jgi:hypothetical protein
MIRVSYTVLYIAALIKVYHYLPLLSIADLPEPPAPNMTKGFLEGPVMYSCIIRTVSGN